MKRSSTFFQHTLLTLSTLKKRSIPVFILIPQFGMNGAALATVASLVVWNFILWSSVRNRLGIESMAFRVFPIRLNK